MGPRFVLAATLALLTAGSGIHQADAGLIPISGYDINDAVISGHGNWGHSYSGTITPGVNFTNGGFGGTTATYSGVGSGTLNDGIIGANAGNSQLFVTPQATDGTIINPTIFLTLSNAFTIDTIDLFGGDFANGIPGKITGVTVTLLKTDFTTTSQTFATSAFGPDFGDGQVNDRVNLIGSSLENVGAFAVFLSDFQGTNTNWFSLTEIELNGDPASMNPVPEPASITLLTLGLGSLGLVRARRRRKLVDAAA